MLTFDRIALRVPTLLLPRAGIDLSKWAVIACDQYTSDPVYWEQVRELTAGQPSTLNLIFPEVFLEEPESEARIRDINGEMERYLAEGILEPQKPGFLLVDRQTQAVPSRKGLIVALDLEQYDYRDGAQSLIRATEGTILDRLPPRIRVREQASIELPHIMVLIDDPQQTVIEPLFARPREKAYDFPLMLGGGHIRGYRVDDTDSIQQVVTALERLADPNQFACRYDLEGQPSSSTPWATAIIPSPPPRRSGRSSRLKLPTGRQSWTIRPATPSLNWSTFMTRVSSSKRSTGFWSMSTSRRCCSG
jgi:hypothetical protein